MTHATPSVNRQGWFALFNFLAYVLMLVFATAVTWIHHDWHGGLLASVAWVTGVLAMLMGGVEEWPKAIPKYLIPIATLLALMDLVGIPITHACT